ncbi:MAG: nuclear transport factor 2 family protein [Novosphingobium sp.]|nr:nuclear transport factor 2 family protein [Novosphingobium sp.]
MDAELQEMLDQFRIRKVLAEYCRGSDRADEALMRSVYAEDSWDDHGIVQADGAEFSRVMCQMVVDTTDTMSHTLGQSLITVDGDEAGAETYFIAVALDGEADGKPCCNQLGGRFVDKLVREAGEWKVKHRVVMRDWSVAIPVTTDWESSKTLRPGERSGADHSYEVFGTVHNA